MSLFTLTGFILWNVLKCFRVIRCISKDALSIEKQRSS